jgi:hypothetical protein
MISLLIYLFNLNLLVVVIGFSVVVCLLVVSTGISVDDEPIYKIANSNIKLNYL